jgi:hypothetical protein
MTEINLIAAFSNDIPANEVEELKSLLSESIDQVAREEGSFKKAKIVFTEHNEQCVLTAELDGVRKEPNPLQLDLAELEDARTDSGARSEIKEALRTYFRKVLGTR